MQQLRGRVGIDRFTPIADAAIPERAGDLRSKVG
jgi:hypothetical protein